MFFVPDSVMKMTKRNMYKQFLLLVCMAFMLSAQAVLANDINIGPLVGNRTISWFGQSFYDDFVSVWQNQRGSHRFDLVIEERPSVRKGTKVFIYHKGVVLYQASVSGTRKAKRGSISVVAQQVFSKAENMSLSGQSIKSSDLAGDEY